MPLTSPDIGGRVTGEARRRRRSRVVVGEVVPRRSISVSDLTRRPARWWDGSLARTRHRHAETSRCRGCWPCRCLRHLGQPFLPPDGPGGLGCPRTPGSCPSSGWPVDAAFPAGGLWVHGRTSGREPW